MAGLLDLLVPLSLLGDPQGAATQRPPPMIVDPYPPDRGGAELWAPRGAKVAPPDDIRRLGLGGYTFHGENLGDRPPSEGTIEDRRYMTSENNPFMRAADRFKAGRGFYMSQEEKDMREYLDQMHKAEEALVASKQQSRKENDEAQPRKTAHR